MLKHFTTPRMTAVEQFFQTNANSELLGAYAWAQAVSSALLPILGDFEVSLRNALHTALSQYYGGVDSFDWMMEKPNPAKATNPLAKPLPAKHKMNPKAQDDIRNVVKKISKKKGGAAPDDVVAALPFGFWEQIINSLDNAAHPVGLQAVILSGVFPFAPDLTLYPYGNNVFKDRVIKLLTRIREARNRIGHHDSIWVTPEFNLIGIVGFIPRRPRHAITSLKLFADRLCWFAGWINPTIPSYIRTTDHWWSFQVLLSRRALVIYRVNGGLLGTYKAVLVDADHTAKQSAPRLVKPTPRIVLQERLLRYRYYY